VTDASSGSAEPGASGVSPYATGGGGVTLERRAAVLYLARLLTGETGLGLHGRKVQRVKFQQAPAHQVDDLVVSAAGDDGTDPFELDIAVRRAPAFTANDKHTKALFGKLLAALPTSQAGAPERRLGICVAGPQPAAQQVSHLAALARQQATAAGFFSLVRTPLSFKKAIRNRLENLVKLVTANLSAAGSMPPPEAVEIATWQLLNRLEILMPRLEPPDETDWSELLNQLEPWAREQTLTGAMVLRDRLESLVASYAPDAADVDLTVLRRGAHEMLHVGRRRRAAAWEELCRLDADARGAVRNSIGIGPAPGPVHVPRRGPTSKIREELRASGAVLVYGESGVGKSALVLGELADAAASDPASYEVVRLNLRLLPPAMVEVRNALGAPLETLLSEMSAPTRVLVLDAADVIIERHDQLLAQLLRAAHTAGVTPWVVSTTDGRAAVRAVMEHDGDAVRELFVDGLDDGELKEVAKAFPKLRRLVNQPRAKELLRRPGIIDLLVRSGSDALPLSEADAFDIVWMKLVRNDERAARGLPDAREQVMRQLATQELRHTDAETVYASLDAAAVAGLRHDGLLRPVERWQPLPAFAHELLRTYAVACVLLSLDDPIGELIESGAPRWALPAVRLAVQVQLAVAETPEAPLAGRFVRLQAALDRLPMAGHGDRWADLATEAVLTLPNSREILADAWPALADGDAAGLQRVLRVIQQRYGRAGFIDRLVAEPLVALLLERGWRSQIRNEVNELLRGWLRGLVLVGAPSGHPLRIALRQRLVSRVAAADERLAEARRQDAARLAARSPEEVAEDEARARASRAVASMSFASPRRRRLSRELPRDLTDDELLEQLALLGRDLGKDGEALLRRVAADAPHRLEPAVEGLLTGHSLASHDARLLAHLVEAYYIEERDDRGYTGIGDDGVRDHRYLGLAVPMSAAYRGPFLALFRADLRAGVASLNRLLNHAAQARVQILRSLTWGSASEPEGAYIVELNVTGERRRYHGDGHVWLWYRGTGVGPYPCMSALQALELVCDEYLKAGGRMDALVRLLLHGCENLAMPALVVGVLVRHLEGVASEIDPFLAEPVIWHLEFGRAVHEHSGLAARTERIVAPERRTWTLREAATWLTLSAAGGRIDALKAVGRRLVARAAELEGAAADAEPLSEELAAVHGWASSLDRDSYRFTRTHQGVLVEPVVDEAIIARLASSNADLARGSEAARLVLRYRDRYDHIVKPAPVSREELLADLATARDLADNPTATGPGGSHDAPAAVAAAALEARFRDELDVPEDDVVWAAGLLIRLVNGLADQGASEDDSSVFGHGLDRSAARALPLLWLPAAHSVRERLAAEGTGPDLVARGIGWIVEQGANETRLFLARSFDPLWRTPCDTTAGQCHHVAALAIVEDTARESLIGHWDPAQQRTARLHIEGPVAPRLQEAGHDRIYVPRLSAAIRGAAPAAVSIACCRADASALLTAALTAHRRGMRSYEQAYHHSGDDAAAAARAVLEVAAAGDNSLLFSHIDDYANHPRLLSEFLRALGAAGEETGRRARAARDLWPAVMQRVIELFASGACRGDDRHYEEALLAAVIPTPSYESGYLHREYEGEPISWAGPLALAPQIEQWLPLAAGHRQPLDALLHLLDRIPADQQAQIGLPWIEQLVVANPEQIANRSYLLPEWLERVRLHALSQALAAWHRIVDALTVAGDARIAALAD
jgi:hypothetical protein